jgi:O-antigen/teichoic acid export membrane protein
MYKKLFSTSLLNAVTAGLNIFSSFITVKVLSLQVFGEFAIFNSFLAFGGLLYAVIPSNFSIFKLQDDENYKTILLSFFILSSIAFSIFVLFMNVSGLIKIDFLTVYLFGVSTFFLGYFDIKFQALGELNRYFIMLFISAILKILTLVAFYYLGYLHNLTDLLWTVTIAQLLILIFFSFQDKASLGLIFKDFSVFKQTIAFIKDNFLTFRPYYLNTFLKRLRENVIVLLFSKFTSKDIIGLFSIFVKIASFVFGLSRTLEAFFMNRENMDKYRETFYQKILYFAISLQFIFLCVGMTYLKIFVNKYFFIEILLLSFLVYPHVFFLLARSEMLSKYNNKEVNIGEGIYIMTVFIGVLSCFGFNIISIYGILSTYGLATLGLQLYLILSLKNMKKKI